MLNILILVKVYNKLIKTGCKREAAFIVQTALPHTHLLFNDNLVIWKCVNEFMIAFVI